MTDNEQAVQTVLFEDGFIFDYAGKIISDPRVALVELVANAYDAGATEVTIELEEEGEKSKLSIQDNGHGMTKDQLVQRWSTLSYNRIKSQGESVVFPDDVRPKPQRVAFGRNGKGRLAGFCFDQQYQVLTTTGGMTTSAQVVMKTGETPFNLTNVEESTASDDGKHGTTVSVIMRRVCPQESEVRDFIGAKFLVDPTFKVTVNGKTVSLYDLEDIDTKEIEVESVGKVRIHRIDAKIAHRTTHLHGITWWVNRRMVGTPGWDGLDGEGHYLDGRQQAAKRYSFIVEANTMADGVKADWTGFKGSMRLNELRKAVHHHVIGAIREILSENRKSTKRDALKKHGDVIRTLPVVSRQMVGRFLDMILEKCPTISPADLSQTVSVLTKLEESRSGYDIIHQLGNSTPDDIDTWNGLMEDWTSGAAEMVLSELGRRVEMIKEMDRLVSDPETDELHQLQPVFERGLWIFGPEYDAMDFTSNLTLVNVMKKFFPQVKIDAPRLRPDFVAHEEGSAGVYSSDRYGDAEVIGLSKVLVVELKRGGFSLSQDEVHQADNYITELLKATRGAGDPRILAYVLGDKFCTARPPRPLKGQDGAYEIIPMQYSTIIKRAEARVFNLRNKLKKLNEFVKRDQDIQEMVETVQESADFVDA